MNYLEWNNSLTAHFFKEERAEKKVDLFITKEEIIRVGSGSDNLFNNDPWSDFVISILTDPLSTSRNLTKRALSWLKVRKSTPENFEYPPYFIYLILSIYPFTEYQDDIHANSYYTPINKILKRDLLPTWKHQTQELNWIPIWQDLEEWSIIERNLQLGFFEYIKTGNHVYVDYPRSQALLNPSFYSHLKELLFDLCISPGSVLSESKIKTILLNRNLGLRNNIIKIIQNRAHPLYSTLFSRVGEFIKTWDGVYETNDENDSIRLSNTIAKLFLCMRIVDGYSLKFFFRLFSKSVYPVDLEFKLISEDTKLPCLEEVNGWSKPLNIGFNENIILDDLDNKWKANFNAEDILIFSIATRYSLGGYITVPNVEKNKNYILLVRNSFSEIDDLIDFYSNGKNGIIRKVSEEYDGIPEGFSIYKLDQIKNEFKEYISFIKNDSVAYQLLNGLHLEGRKFFKYLTPKFLFEGISSQEKVYVKYDNEDSYIKLRKANNDVSVFELKSENGDKLDYNRSFQFFFWVNSKYQQIGKGSFQLLASEEPNVHSAKTCYNKFGNIIDLKDDISLCENEFIGNTRDLLSYNYYLLDRSIYLPNKNDHNFPRMANWEYDPQTDLLLNFCSVKGSLKNSDFYDAFKTIFNQNNNFSNYESDNINKLARQSLNYYVMAGYLSRSDVTYEKVQINRPQLIQLPDYTYISNGYKFILIGARTRSLVMRIIDFCRQNNDYYNLPKPDTNENKKYLLPSSLLLYINCTKDDLDNKIDKLCSECKIKYQKRINFLPALLEYCGSLDQYFTQIQSDQIKFTFSGKKKKFNIDSLGFENIESDRNLDNFSLVQYQINPYTFIHKLFVDNKSYTVDKNYGIYLVLKDNKKRIIEAKGTLNQKNEFTFPSSTPLPLLYNKVLFFQSGEFPANIIENGKWYTKYSNIDGVVADKILEKLNQKEARYA